MTNIHIKIKMKERKYYTYYLGISNKEKKRDHKMSNHQVTQLFN